MATGRPARRVVATGLVVLGLVGGTPAGAQPALDTRNAAAILRAWRTTQPADRAALLTTLLDQRTTATTALRAAVVAGDLPTRAAACAMLGAVRDRGAVPVLLAATRDAEPVVQAEAVSALRVLRDASAAPRLRVLVRGSGDRAVRKRAMTALAGLGDRGDQAVVRPFLNDPDATVRVIAAGALAMLGSAEGEGLLLAAIDGDDPGAQKNATYALGFLGTPAARARLEQILADPAGRWKSYAVLALAALDAASQGPAARAASLETLARGSDRIVKYWALDRLTDLPGLAADAALQRLAGGGGRAGQRAALRLRLREGR